METHRKIRILRIKDHSAEEMEDFVAVEKKVRISVNGQHALSLFCSPSMIREFIVGVVFNEGLIAGGWCSERMAIEHGEEILVDIPATGPVFTGEKTITSGCAGGISISRPLPGEKLNDKTVIGVKHIRDLYREFQKKSDGYKSTGGVHSAALADKEKMIVFAEDIGRHNAVDKVVGYAILEEIPFEGKIMLASGRLSSEIVTKCVRCRIPLLISRAAPTSLSIEIASSAGITLVGFMRGDRMNIYTGEERIKI